MLKNKNGIIFILCTVISFSVIYFFNNEILPHQIAQNAVSQLEDSNTAYLNWKNMSNYAELFYAIPVFFLVLSVFSFLKKK